jgi:hypothetical protein
MSAIDRIVCIENDFVIPGFLDDKFIIRNGIDYMKVEDKDQSLFQRQSFYSSHPGEAGFRIPGLEVNGLSPASACLYQMLPGNGI